MDILFLIPIGIALLGAGVGLGYLMRQLVASSRRSSIEARLKKLIEDSKAEAKEILLDAKEKAVKALDEVKHEEKDRLGQIRRIEERLIDRETTIDRRVQDLEKREKELGERIEKVKTFKVEVEQARENALKELERV